MPTSLVPMQAHLGGIAARMREAAGAFLARGWAARLAASTVVSVAAIVWLGALVVLLRILSVIAFVAAGAWFVWLVGRVWRPQQLERGAQGGSLTRLVLVRARSLAARELPRRVESDENEATDAAQWEAGLAEVRSSVAALNADLLGWQERLIQEVERCQRELATQIVALHELVDRAVSSEQAASDEPEPPKKEPRRRAPRAVAPQLSPEPEVEEPAEPDVESVLLEIEAELRVEKIEEREQRVAELEERLNRRERELAALVNETQAKIA